MTAPVRFPPSIWAETAPGRVPAAALTGIIETDTAVIGGGFTGLSAALHLAREGKDVVVLEGQAVGWGASGRNNGQVIPTLTAAEPDAWVARHGETGRRFAELIGGSASLLFDIVRREGLAAEAEQTGWFQPAHSPGRIRLSQARVEAWTRFGLEVEFKDAAQTADLLGTDFWHGGMLAPSGGHINPLALARELAGAAERHGGRIFEQSPATWVEREGAEWVVTTPGGTVRARALILATNAYTGQLSKTLAPRLAKSFIPVHSWQMATEPVGANLRRKILPGRQAVSDTRGDLRFFRYDARNRLITGAAIIAGVNDAERARAKAARNLAEAFPDLGVPKMTHVWSGYLSMNWDRFPRVHRLGPDGWAWVGCNGRGVALGTALGREMARAVAGEDPRGLALPVTEPQVFPYHTVLTRTAPAYLAWLRRKDMTEPDL
ncbi:NAD(P)/FAD-dependent oxidoreductase [Rhodovulum euryhalinum]|uniref:Glycine/D-amino acid oxidase-like deaminating enzyme n=1 Tax=Rhodovulum euryhalinum TaxID=35805 RepID=A0A4R2K9J9_9RHOB|nr:FAD-binding oxidoreductase [Rhodovulum euryhalinum]TCO70083.1 glycine/D-amino acid oxidase-like deaminating enzyme [Rhodovulum euryhalinum]